MCPESHVGSVAKLLTVKPGWEGFISDLFYCYALKTSSENPGCLQILVFWDFKDLIFTVERKETKLQS